MGHPGVQREMGSICRAHLSPWAAGRSVHSGEKLTAASHTDIMHLSRLSHLDQHEPLLHPFFFCFFCLSSYRICPTVPAATARSAGAQLAMASGAAWRLAASAAAASAAAAAEMRRPPGRALISAPGVQTPITTNARLTLQPPERQDHRKKKMLLDKTTCE